MTIVTVGYRKYAVRKASDAATLIRIMAEAAPLESKFIKDREWFWPDRGNHRNEISMVVVSDSQILRQKPPSDGEIEVDVVAPRRRGLRLTGPSIKVGEG